MIFSSMEASIAILIFLLLPGVLSAAAPRGQGQIRQFSFYPQTPCASTIYGNDNGTCIADPTIAVCGNNSFCPYQQACGIWGGVEGCCVEEWDAAKSSSATDATSNISCTPYKNQLSNFNFVAHGTSILPQTIFCNDKLYPYNYILFGTFNSAYSNITTDTYGTTCCPNIYDSVVMHTATNLNQTQALCVLPLSVDGKASTTSSNASSTSAGAATSSSKSAGPMTIIQPALFSVVTGFSFAVLAFVSLE